MADFDPLSSYAREELLARLQALSVREPVGADAAPEARCRATLTVALGRALGRDVSWIVDDDGGVLCRSALFSPSGECAFGARCALSHRLPAAAHEAALARVVEARARARELEAMREAAAKRALAAPQPAWLERRRRTRVIAYDTARYGLREALAAVLELDRFVPPDGAAAPAACAELSSEPLERRLQLLHATSPDGLHGPPPLCPALSRGLALGGRVLPPKWKRARFDKSATIRRLHGTERWARFLRAYDAFVAEVVAPHLARRPRAGEAGSEGEEDEAPEPSPPSARAAPAGTLAYQRPPTVRVHCPGHVAPIGLHCDGDYPKHEGGEVNVWVPLTRSYGSNALWLESAPGAGDFAPVELPYGSALIFNGCRCRHYAMPNATGATRVSFDLRAIPAEVWRDDYDRKIGDYDASVCEPRRPHDDAVDTQDSRVIQNERGPI